MGRHAWAQALEVEPTVEPTSGMLGRLAELASRAAVHSWAVATGADRASAPPDDSANELSNNPATDPAADAAAAIEGLADLASAAARAAAINASRYPLTTEPAHARAIAPASWRRGWVALLLSTAARAGLTMLSCMLLTSVAFSPLGWHSTVVMSDSMAPRLTTGDVVIARPVATKRLRVGQILLVSDPDHANELRLHRLAVIRPDGMLTLRGDANPANDSTPVAPAAVHGVASLRVPYIGTAMWLLRSQDYRDLAILIAILAGIIAAACIYRACDDDIADADDDSDADHSSGTGHGSGHYARHRRPAHTLNDPTQDGQHTPRARRTAAEPGRVPSTRVAVRRVGSVSVLTAIIIGAGFTAAGPVTAASRFSRTDSNPVSNWTAQKYFTCDAAVIHDNPAVYYRLNDISNDTVVDSSGNHQNGSFAGNGYPTLQTGSCVRDSNNYAITTNNVSGYVSTPTRVFNPTTFTVELWFKTNTTLGGRLIGFGDAETGTSTNTDRHVYMTGAGKLSFGVAPGSVKTVISSPLSYNDDAWHLVDATLSTNGMQLFVDGATVASGAATTAFNYFNRGGYWRIGDDNTNGWSGATGNSFAATADDAAIYTTALSNTQIADHHAAGR